MDVNGSDTGTVRLFSIDLPREAVARFVTEAGTGEWPMKYAFGATSLQSRFVDVVDIRDLGEMPLSTYLVQAYDVIGDDFATMKPRIDALSGHVIILPSQAFEHVSQTLTISAPLRWIGTFSAAVAKRSGSPLRMRIGNVVSDADTPPKIGRGNSLILKLVVLGVAVLALLTLAAILR